MPTDATPINWHVQKQKQNKTTITGNSRGKGAHLLMTRKLHIFLTLFFMIDDIGLYMRD